MIKTIALAAITALVVSLVAVSLVGNEQSDSLGDVGTRFPNGIRIGSTGTLVSRINTGTCYLAPDAATITGSSSALVTCQGTAAWGANGRSALTGVVSGSNVMAMFSTTTSALGVSIVGASASTSADGYIVLEVENDSGATLTWPTTGAASGTVSYIVTR